MSQNCEFQLEKSSKIMKQILLFFLFIGLCVFGYASDIALEKAYEVNKEKLLFHPESDPFGREDHFRKISEDDLNKYWGHSNVVIEDISMEQKLMSLQKFDLPIYVTVKLVGFAGNGNGKIDIDQESLSRLLDNLRVSGPIYVSKVNAGQDRRLPVHVKYIFSVEHSRRKLVQDVQKAVSTHMKNEGTSLIPFSVVDRLVKKDFEQMHSSSIVIYIINPRSQSSDKSYIYVEDGNPKPCGSSIWTSTDRYIWIDLTSGPMKLGPRTVGEGLVTEFSLPRIDQYLARKHKFMEKEFLSDLSTFVYSACEYLVNPSIDHLPLPLSFDSPKLHLQLILVHDGTNENEDIDWSHIQSEISGLKLHGQSFHFSKHRLSVAECKACARAYMLSVKSHTSPIRKSGLSAYVHQFLDSVELHSWLQKLLPDISHATASRHHPMETTVPVFVFSLKSDDIILLDRFHSALSFSDMVVAVQTRVGSVVQDFHCDGKSITTQSLDIQRELFAAILRTVFGVLPTFERWSPLHGSPVVEYMWSSASTPFGPFSFSSTMSFVQKDAAKRNVVFSFMTRFIQELNTTLGHFTSTELNSPYRFDNFLSHQDLLRFMDRWNVIDFKLRHASGALSLHNYDHALWWVRSVQIDLRSIHSLVHEVGSKVHSYIDCNQEKRISVSRLVRFAGICSGIAMLFYAVRLILKGTKTKQS